MERFSELAKMFVRARTIGGAVALASGLAFAGPAVAADDIPMPKADPAVSAQVPPAIKDRGHIHVVSTFGYAPQQFYAEDGVTPDGFSVDLGKALAAVAGLEAKFTNASFDSIIPGLDAGRFDMAIAAMSATVERGAKVHFVIYQNTGAGLLVRKGNPKNVHGLKDLCGLKVASLRGSIYNQVIEGVSAKCKEGGREPVELSTYETADSVFQALFAGRVDANYRDTAPLIYAARASGGRVEVVGPEYPDKPYGIAISDDNVDLARAMTAALESLIKSGTYQAILDKWGLGVRAVKSAVLAEVGSPASAYPVGRSAVDVAFGQ